MRSAPSPSSPAAAAQPRCRSASSPSGATSRSSSSSSCSPRCGARASSESQRGVKGGYTFARDPSEVTVLEVVELLDGPLGAGAESIFADAAAAARTVLQNATIADVVESENRAAGAQMYYI